MPQGRILLKRISESKRMPQLKTDGARLLYSWLIPHVDVNGCFSADPEVVKGKVFTKLRKSTKTVAGYLQNLAEVGSIVLYDMNGEQYLCIPDFAEKQPTLNPDREAKTTIPLPTPDQLKTSSGLTPLKVKESKVKESKYTPEFENFWRRFKGRWNPDKDRYVKVGKFEASQEWRRLSAEEKKKAIAVADKVRGKFVPDACRWLKKKLFDDFTERKE